MAKKTVDEKLAALRVKLVGVEADAEDGVLQEHLLHKIAKLEAQRTSPSEADRKIALEVLVFYQKTANLINTKTEQDTPHEWSRGAEVWIELLDGDPEKTMFEYLQEYRLGHDKFADE